MALSKRPAVCVTGGAGYIGSHTCKALFKAGYEPVVLDDLSAGHAKAVRWGPLETIDIGDSARVADRLRHYRPVAILHFAGSTQVAESLTRPEAYYQNNVCAPLSFLHAAIEVCGPLPFIFSSSCATYGLPLYTPISETHPQNPITPYGASKLFFERILADVACARRFKYMNLRYFNAAGADLEGEIGEEHSPETHLIPLVMEAAAGLRSSIALYGTDYNTDDGTAVRDYIHVEDLARAHVQALEHLLDGGNSCSLNLGTGYGISVRRIIERARAITGKKIEVREEGRRPGDPPVLVADSGRARDILHWKPERSGLDTILTTAWSWQLAKTAASSA